MSRTHRCSFCRDRARLTFDGAPFCYWHILWFYLGMNQRWTD